MIRLNKDIPGLLKQLKTFYPQATCSLRYKSPFELLVATILSAQCTDARVNLVTPALFNKFPTAQKMAAAPQEEIEKLIRSTGFFRNKARHIRLMAKKVAGKFAGCVPDSMVALLSLPGVARKTANVVLGTGYGKAEGVVVDTHVWRVSQRLGFSKENTPEKIEKDLMAKVPRSKWTWLSHALIAHGRAICVARTPRCPVCPLRVRCANPVIL